MQFHSTSDLRSANRVAVLSSIARRGAASRLAVAEATGLTSAAVSRITRELIDIGILAVADEPVAVGGRGRRVHELQIAENGLYIITMVITANRRVVSLVNGKGALCSSVDLDSLALANAETAIDVFAQTANELIQKSNIDRSRLLGISAVVAVNTNPSYQSLISSNVLGWTDVDLADQLSTKLSLPVHLEARSAALLQTELWEKPAQFDRSVVLINNGWWIGTSVSMHNTLLESSVGRIGQVAHLTVDGQSAQCYCGKVGCLDAVASGAAIVNALERRKIREFAAHLSLIQKLNLAIHDSSVDAKVARVFQESGEIMGRALNSVASLFEPERILLAGATGRHGRFFTGVQSTFMHTEHCSLQLCEADSVQAAVRTGLDAFLFSENFNINRLPHSAGRAAGRAPLNMNHKPVKRNYAD